MKTPIKNLFLLPVLIAGFGLIPAGRVTAQTFTTLYSFLNTTGLGGPNSITNSDGANPAGGLILVGNTLYGTAAQSGSFLRGTVFAGNTNGTGFTGLHSFNPISDGAFPQAGLILEGDTLYGTAFGGGSAGAGTVFKVNTNGTGFTILHSFTAISSPDRS